MKYRGWDQINITHEFFYKNVCPPSYILFLYSHSFSSRELILILAFTKGISAKALGSSVSR